MLTTIAKKDLNIGHKPTHLISLLTKAWPCKICELCGVPVYRVVVPASNSPPGPKVLIPQPCAN